MRTGIETARIFDGGNKSIVEGFSSRRCGKGEHTGDIMEEGFSTVEDGKDTLLQRQFKDI